MEEDIRGRTARLLRQTAEWCRTANTKNSRRTAALMEQEAAMIERFQAQGGERCETE